VEKSQTDPRYYFETNLVRGIALLDTMLETGCTRIIFSSTAAIFGEPVQVPIDETHPQAPINAYGASKLMFETVLDWYHRAYGLRFNAFRYFNAAGASDRFGECHQPESHLIPILCEVAQGRRENITLFGNDYPTDDGTCVRDYVHVLDLADAHILALGNLEERPSARYNLGNGRGFSNLEVLRTVERVSGHPVSFEYGDRRAGDPAVLVASSARAREELGWSPRYGSVEDIVRTAWDWHEAHPRGYDGAGGI
jgi:UDP-glucose 4-epimerase